MHMHHHHHTGLNREGCLRTLLLSAFLAEITWLLSTGKILFFVHPRMLPFIQLSVCFFVIMLSVELFHLFRPQAAATGNETHHNHAHRYGIIRRLSYIPFVLTVLLVAILPTNPLNASLVDNKGLNSRMPVSGKVSNIQLKESSFVRLTDANFVNVLSELNTYPTQYAGKEIEMSGFAYHNQFMPSGKFSLARYVIACCAGDAAPYGLLCTTAEPASCIENHWYQIHGILQTDQFDNGKAIAYVKVDWIKEIPAPSNPYVYP